MQAKVIGKRMLVKPLEKETTKSGLVMVREKDDYSARAIVVLKGTKEDEHSKHVSIGDVISIAHPTGTKVVYQGQDHRLIDCDAVFIKWEGHPDQKKPHL